MMKKLLFVLLLLAAVPCFVWGKDNKKDKEKEQDEDPEIVFDEMRLVNGSFEPFKRKTNAYYVIDWSNVTVVKHKKKKIEEVYGSIQDYYAKFPDKKYEDWLELQKILYEYGTEHFNKKSKGIKLVDKKEESSLTFKLNVTQLDFGNTGDYFLPTYRPKRWGGAIIDGEITIIDNATGEELCNLSLIQFQSYNSYTAGDTWRLKSITLQIIDRLLKHVKNQK